MLMVHVEISTWTAPKGVGGPGERTLTAQVDVLSHYVVIVSHPAL